MSRSFQATLMVALTASCAGNGVRITSDEYSIQVDPILLGDQDPFAGETQLLLSIRTGFDVERFPLGVSASASWTAVGVPVLDEAEIGLSVLSPSADPDDFMFEQLRAFGGRSSISHTEGEMRLTVAVPSFGRPVQLGVLEGTLVSHGAAMALLPTGELYLFGGTDVVLTSEGAMANNPASSQVLKASIHEPEFTIVRVGEIPALPASSQQRVGATATVVTWKGRDHILVVGGRRTWIPHTTASSQAFLWDPATDTSVWSGVAPEDRSQHVALARSDGEVMLLGGLDDVNAGYLTFDVFEATEPPRFRARGEVPGIGDLGFAWADLGPDGVMVCGGGRFEATSGLVEPTPACRRLKDDGEPSLLLDLASGLGIDNPQRMWHAMAPTGDGMVLVTGGTSQPIAVGATEQATSTAWLFNPDPTDYEWMELPDMNHARAMHKAIPLPDGRVLLVGGVAAAVGLAPSEIGELVPCAEVYDPISSTFTDLEDCPTAATGANPAVSSSVGGVALLAGIRTGGGGDALGLVGTASLP